MVVMAPKVKGIWWWTASEDGWRYFCTAGGKRTKHTRLCHRTAVRR